MRTARWTAMAQASVLAGALMSTACESRLIDKTRRHVPYVSPGNLQRFEAEVVPAAGYRIDRVFAVVPGLSSPLLPMSETTTGIWAAERELPRCQEVFTYRYRVQSSNQEETRWDEFPSPPFNYDRFIYARPKDCLGTNQLGTIFEVNTFDDTVDANPGDGHCSSTADPAAKGSVCSLRAAIMEANAKSGWDSVELQPGRYRLTLSGGDEGDALDDSIGDLDVVDDVSIMGFSCGGSLMDYLDRETLEDIDTTASIVKIQGTGLDRVLQIGSGEVHLDCLIVTAGRLPSSLEGAGIRNAGHLRMRRVAVTGGEFANVGRTNQKGAGIYNSNSLSMTESALVANHGATDGAAVGGTTGGALFNEAGATAQVESTLIAFNSAARGRGIANDGQLTVINSTFVGNESGTGAGALAADLYNTGTAEVSFSTFSAASWMISNYATLTLSNSLLDMQGPDPACEGALDASWGNLATDDSCFPPGTGVANTEVLFIEGLAYELADRGGFTPVLPLAAYSPQDNATPLDHCPLTDQRGARRPLEPSRCDVGASEFEGDLP